MILVSCAGFANQALPGFSYATALRLAREIPRTLQAPTLRHSAARSMRQRSPRPGSLGEHGRDFRQIPRTLRRLPLAACKTYIKLQSHDNLTSCHQLHIPTALHDNRTTTLSHHPIHIIPSTKIHAILSIKHQAISLQTTTSRHPIG